MQLHHGQLHHVRGSALAHAAECLPLRTHTLGVLTGVNAVQAAAPVEQRGHVLVLPAALEDLNGSRGGKMTCLAGIKIKQ